MQRRGSHLCGAPLVRGCLTFTAERDSGTYGPDDSRTFAIRCHLGVIAVVSARGDCDGGCCVTATTGMGSEPTPIADVVERGCA